MNTEKKVQFNSLYFIISLVIIMLFQDWWASDQQVEVIPYSQFERELSQGLVDSISIDDQRIYGAYKESNENSKSRFITTRVPPDLAQRLSEFDVKYEAVIRNTFITGCGCSCFDELLTDRVWVDLWLSARVRLKSIW
jgi:cell division protease FtsH